MVTKKKKSTITNSAIQIAVTRKAEFTKISFTGSSPKRTHDDWWIRKIIFFLPQYINIINIWPRESQTLRLIFPKLTLYCPKSINRKKEINNQSSTGSSGASSALRLMVITGHSACFTQNSLTVPTKTLQKQLTIINA